MIYIPRIIRKKIVKLLEKSRVQRTVSEKELDEDTALYWKRRADRTAREALSLKEELKFCDLLIDLWGATYELMENGNELDDRVITILKELETA